MKKESLYNVAKKYIEVNCRARIMNLENIARTYVSAAELEEEMRAQSSDSLDHVSELRSDLHARLMDALRENHIPVADRAEAAAIAFELVKKGAPQISNLAPQKCMAGVRSPFAPFPTIIVHFET
jgi:hypothetical protein